MAAEPTKPLTAAAFLNHLRRVLDASLQRWEFGPDAPTLSGACLTIDVRFLGSGRSGRISWTHANRWAFSDDSMGHSAWLTARLNGQVRDEAGNLSEVAK